VERLSTPHTYEDNDGSERILAGIERPYLERSPLVNTLSAVRNAGFCKSFFFLLDCMTIRTLLIAPSWRENALPASIGVKIVFLPTLEAPFSRGPLHGPE